VANKAANYQLLHSRAFTRRLYLWVRIKVRAFNHSVLHSCTVFSDLTLALPDFGVMSNHLRLDLPIWEMPDPNYDQVMTIGGHLVRYLWSAISDWAWYWNFRYRTKRAESDIISDIGIKFIQYPISDIPSLIERYSSLELQCLLIILRSRSLNPPGGIIFFL
jgi:hypothetical protein